MAGIDIRPAVEDDAGFMFDMMRGLAVHVDELDHFSATIEDVRRDGFGPGRHYESLIATVDGAPAGLSTYYFTYSTYTGRPCLFVLDLIVGAKARGLSLGKALMGRMSTIALENGCCRIDLQVHNTNDALGFYEAIGMTGSIQIPYSLDGEALKLLAAQETLSDAAASTEKS